MSDLRMIHRFQINDPFFNRYETLVREVVLPYQERALNDLIDGAEKSHCIENFRMAAEVLRTGSCDGEFYGMVFQDSDIAKWLEGAAYSLALHPDAALERRCDDIIDLIASAQHPDGYLNTYFTVKAPGKRWQCLADAHELYCAGHMMEAAVAYAECTGKRKLLEVMCRMADHIYQHFIVEGAEGYSGHPEVELALMRLYRCTGNEKYRELATHFIDVRGVNSQFFSEELKKYGWSIWGGRRQPTDYYQCSAPVREQQDAVGHAVRAVYLYSGMAEAAMLNNDETLAAACRRMWDSITTKRMYLTGAIGSSAEGEAFSVDYHLPNEAAYAETCASIGLIFFAGRMLRMEKNSRYADVMERALYNCVLAGMQLDGTKFFYVNPLEVQPGVSGKAQTLRHARPVRPKWFACACCPPNVARMLPSVAEYAWGEEQNTVYSHLFIGGTLACADGKLTLETAYPYDGRLTYRFQPDGAAMAMNLAIRLPDWSAETKVLRNGAPAKYECRDGYAYLTGPFAAEDTVTVELDMRVRRVYANTLVAADSGKAALQRGPLVYCAEGADNGGNVLGLFFKENGSVTVGDWEGDRLNGIRTLEAEGYCRSGSDALYTTAAPTYTPCTIRLTPYYTWGNRGENEMRVWLPEHV